MESNEALGLWSQTEINVISKEDEPTMSIVTLALIGIISLFSSQIGDIVSTRRFLARGGKEANPFIRFLFAKIGFNATCLIKMTMLITGLGLIISFVGWVGGLLAGIVSTFFWIITALNWLYGNSLLHTQVKD